MDKLKSFYIDKAMRMSLKTSLEDFVEATGGRWAVNGQDTTGVKDASTIISLYFKALDDIYGEKKKSKIDNPE